MTIHDWADREAADILSDWADREAADLLEIIKTSGFTRGSLQRSIAKRLRKIADARITDHQLGVERAFDRMFGPEEVVAP
jgi:hypothetical protein